MQDSAKPYRRWLGPTLFALAFVLYCLTLSPGAFPGESARLIVSHSGLDPFPPLSHPLWNAVVRIIGLIPIGSLALRLNLFSALCGAGVVWLVYRLTTQIPRNRTFEEIDCAFSARRVQSFSGLITAVLLATCIPFWLISTRAHTAAFDLLLVLWAVHLVFRLADQPERTRLVCSVALLCGAGTTEFGTFVLLMPLLAVAVILALWQGRALRTGVLLKALGCYVLGLLVYVLFAWQYWLSPAREWREFNNFFMVLWFVWREQYWAIAKGLPQIGWMLVFFTTIVPGIVLLGFPKRLPNRAVRPSSFALQGVFTALGVAVLLNTRLSPWALLNWRPLLVTPYVFTAIWMGYLVGYWYVVVSHKDRFEPPGSAAVRRFLHVLFYPLLFGFLGVICVKSFRVADGRQCRPMLSMADEIVADLGDRTWLVSNGILDDNILLAANERGRDLHILNLAAAGAKPYREYVASLFDSDRLKGLARVGLPVLLSEWFAKTADIEGQAAVLANPDLWLGAGLQVKPRKTVFLGVRDFDADDAEALMAEHRTWWNEFEGAIKEQALSRALPMTGWNRWGLNHAGKVANNLGVFFEDHERDDLAYEAYAAARRLDTNNVSALLNQISLATRKQYPEAEDLTAEFEAVVKRLGTRLDLWSLSYHYGYVRHPDAYLTRGMAWVMSGKRNMAIADVQRAVDLGARNDAVQLALASLYFSEEMDDQSENAFQAVLEKDPDRAEAVLGLARVAMRKGHFDSARGYLARLRELGYPPGLLTLEEITLESLMGHASAAREKAEALVKSDPQNLKAWMALGILAALDGDTPTVDKCVAKLEETGLWSSSMRLAMAQLSLSAGKPVMARQHLERLLQAQPNNSDALELLVQVDASAGLRDEMEEDVEKLLGVDPANAVGNFMLGGLQMLRGEYALAEASFRASLEAERMPDALNELAWLMQRRGAYEEALPLAQESVGLNQLNAAAWDTLGVALIHLDRLEEAEEALKTSLGLRPQNPHTIYHTALLFEKKGLFREALEMVEPLQERMAEMDPETYTELRRLVARLRARP